MYEYYCSIRDSLGLTDYKVAKLTGIGQSTFSDWKAGRSAPKQEKLQKIASCLGVSIDALMTGKDTPKESDTGKRYYFNDETAEMAQELYDDPDQRWLFRNTRGMPPEDMEAIKTMVEALRRKERV